MISFVLPNIATIPQRGGLEYRWELAKTLGCSFIEMPADFIKNNTEVKKSGQDLCSPLLKDSIEKLYCKDEDIPITLKYILHTEPSLPRTDGYGISAQAALKWYDVKWTENFAEMICNITEFLGIPADKIEIHPGDRRNTYEDILNGASVISSQYYEKFNQIPDILLENRTGQVVSSGTQIDALCNVYYNKFIENLPNFGIVLDIQQLFTVTKNLCITEFNKIP